MKKLLITAMCLLPGTVWVQDLNFDIGHTQRCISRGDTFEEMRSCIGASADICMSATDMGGTTVGMGGCINFELSYWDDRLNAFYGSLRAKEVAEDADLADSAGYVRVLPSY